MYSRVERITPEIAADYLTHNRRDGEHENRRQRAHKISAYAADMKAGRWQLTNQGIAFYENGDLADGQHRLEAIILAGVPVDMYVTYDVPNESVLYDRGMVRSTTDVLEMGGNKGPAYSTNAIAATRFLFAFSGRQHLSEGVIMDFVTDNAEKMGLAVNLSKRGKNKTGGGFNITTKACIIAAAFCALYCGIPEDKLSAFFTVANTGFTDSNDEKPAIVLRNYMIQDYEESHSGRKGAFVTATNAIKDYANGIPRTKKYRSDTDPAFWGWTKKLLDSYK